jgi:phage shock protein A
MAWDRAEDELDQLQDELRRMRQRHQAAERDLLARINTKKRLQRELLERAGDVPPSTELRAG